MATIGREQAAALLKHRCDLTSFDGEIDDSALQAGSPAACVPILRYIFISFSEALDEFCAGMLKYGYSRRPRDERRCACD